MFSLLGSNIRQKYIGDCGGAQEQVHPLEMNVVWDLLMADLIVIGNPSKDPPPTYLTSLISCVWRHPALRPHWAPKRIPEVSRIPMLLFFLETLIPLFPPQKSYPTNWNFLYAVEPSPTLLSEFSTRSFYQPPYLRLLQQTPQSNQR